MLTQLTVQAQNYWFQALDDWSSGSFIRDSNQEIDRRKKEIGKAFLSQAEPAGG